MQNYFGVNLEFDHNRFYQDIHKAVREQKSSYVCIVDANVLTIANREKDYREILNKSLVNSCDGSSIAFLINKIYNTEYSALNGPTIFKKLITSDTKQVLLGGDLESASMLEEKLKNENDQGKPLIVISLPFRKVEDFDYKNIADQLNKIQPDIIWVSLGAPKQEKFMYNLQPYLNSGVMFGIGAAINFYIGQIKMPSYAVGGVSTLWLSRIFTEPKKQLKRVIPYLMIIPKIYRAEKKKLTYLKDNGE